jgi:hypothetical protein
MYKDVGHYVKHYWESNETGALFLKLDNGYLLQLFFVKGELRSAKCNNHTGVGALEQASITSVAKAQFFNDAVSRIANDLPPTSAIIDMINTNQFDRNLSTQCVMDNPITFEEKVVVQAIFTEYIGPIADFVFSDAYKKALSLDELIQSLMMEIDDVNRQMEFRKQVGVALGRL